MRDEDSMQMNARMFGMVGSLKNAEENDRRRREARNRHLNVRTISTRYNKIGILQV